MAVATQIIEPRTQGMNITNPSSFQGNWFTLVSDCSAADNSGSTITSPTAQITAATRTKTQIPYGTSLLIRLSYDDGITFTTDPVVQLFGYDQNGAVVELSNESGNHEITLTAAESTDVTDGTDKFSDVAKGGLNRVDFLGCTHVLCGVKTAAVAGAGNAALTRVQAKIL